MPRKAKAATKEVEANGVDHNGAGITEEKPVVTKRVSGRVRKQPTPEIVPEPVKKVARGGKKRGTQESSAAVDEEITEPPKKASKGAKKSTVEENGDSKEKTENTKKANGRGKRGATPAVEEAAEPIKKAQGGKSKKPLAEETIEEEDEEQVEEEEPAVEEPAKKSSGRGSKKAKDSTAKDTASTKKGSTGGRGRKRAGSAKKEQDITEEAEDEEDAEPAKKAKVTAKAAKIKLNPTKTPYEKINFNQEKEHNLKISSWNVAGVRAWIGKGGLEFIEHEKPDIICFQELKCNEIPDEARLTGYHPYWLCNASGRAGVAIFSKKMPINVEYGIGDEEQDSEGHMMTAEYEKFFLVNVYVPNSGRKLVTLPKRMRWDTLLHEYVTKLNSKKPVIICGDMNVSHQEIDLANPKSNKRNAGFTQEERDGLTKLLSLGYVDTFRHFYPDLTGAYTFWTYMGNARSKNVGWRLDYFIVTEKILSKIVDNVMRSEILGSDHCPITLFLNV